MLEKKKIASLLKQLLVQVTMFPSKKKSPLFQSVCVKYRKGKAVSFDSFFDSYSKQEIVTTFMALLELMKSRRDLCREQENNYSEILFVFNTETQQGKIQQRWRRKHSDIS